MDWRLRKVVILVASLNLAYFGVEFGVALAIGSVSLFADSIDFLEDTSLNFLIAVALGWTAIKRARLGMALAGILLIPGVATLWTAWQKFMAPTAACTDSAVPCRYRRVDHQLVMRVHSRALPIT